MIPAAIVRHARIVMTLGPATDGRERDLIVAGLMVAWGDLGVELGPEKMVAVQNFDVCSRCGVQVTRHARTKEKGKGCTDQGKGKGMHGPRKREGKG